MVVEFSSIMAPIHQFHKRLIFALALIHDIHYTRVIKLKRLFFQAQILFFEKTM
uniref:Uncharacterized protein n=1 Tax=Anguilla anguilla TaxID=7936 RepID=A0A0E9XHY6_ANGAN